MKKIPFFVLHIFIALMFSGCFFDQTSLPKRSDVIVSLAGGKEDQRLNKAKLLLEQNLSASQIMIHTGNTIRTFVNQNGTVSELKVIKFHTKNTQAEVRFIKNYMLENNLSSVMVVSDPPHSRRILFFANTVYDFPSSGLSIIVVSSDAPWWNPSTYSTDSTALEFVWMESIKYLYYNTAYYLGFLEE